MRAQAHSEDEDARNMPKKKKSRRFTLLFALIFAAIGGMIFMGMVAGLVVNLDSLDGAWLVKLNETMRSMDHALLLWRLVLYSVMLLLYFQIHQRKCLKAGHPEPIQMACHMTLRIGAYLTFFELLVAQNLLGNAIYLISHWE